MGKHIKTYCDHDWRKAGTVTLPNGKEIIVYVCTKCGERQ